MKFNSAKGFVFPAVIVILAIMAVLSLAAQVYLAAFIIGLVLLLFIWMLYNTYYVIKDNQLLYRSAFLKGVISIDAIYEIERNKTMYAGLKPALATKGLIVKYNKYDDIYLSPKDANGFVEALIQINPAIKIMLN
ncbi:MAG: PH domain-containing protein [Bacteroidota bacterium]